MGAAHPSRGRIVWLALPHRRVHPSTRQEPARHGRLSEMTRRSPSGRRRSGREVTDHPDVPFLAGRSCIARSDSASQCSSSCFTVSPRFRPGVDNAQLDDVRELRPSWLHPVADLGCREAQIRFELAERRDQLRAALVDARLEIGGRSSQNEVPGHQFDRARRVRGRDMGRQILRSQPWRAACTATGIAMSISYGDRSVATLRSLVTAIERQFAIVPPPEELRAAWAEMVDVLALGPPPELRTCPTCGEIGMRAATRCMRCWSSLPLLAAATTPGGS
jgi:hypothetical protein